MRSDALRLAVLATVLLSLPVPSSAAAPAASPSQAILRHAPGLRPEVLRLGLAAYAEARRRGAVERARLTIIDFELPSYRKRLWVVVPATGEVLLSEWVAHGMGDPAGSGGDLRHATAFSNAVGSRMSSLGTFVTAETYLGKHGYSLRLDGLEKGVNDAARRRAVVIHGAAYVSAARAKARSMGRSWGCPAVRVGISRTLIDAIAGGSVVWAYYPEAAWLEASAFLPRSGPSGGPAVSAERTAAGE